MQTWECKKKSNKIKLIKLSSRIHSRETENPYLRKVRWGTLFNVIFLLRIPTKNILISDPSGFLSFF